MAGVVSLGLGLVSLVTSTVQTADANGQAKQTQEKETQLLNEAQQQANQQTEQKQLIQHRNAQEEALNPVAPKFSGSNTIITGPLGIPASPQSNAPKALLGS